MNYKNNNNGEYDTQTTAPSDILKINILQRRNEILNHIEDYYRKDEAGSQPPTFYIIASVRTLFLDLEAWISRTTKPDEFETWWNLIMKKPVQVSDALKLFRKLSRWCDDNGLTRIDLGKKYDTTNVETENTMKGL